MNKQFSLTKEELNELSKLITNTNIIAHRACKEGYMSKNEIDETIAQCDIRTSALAKLIGQSIENE